MQVSAQMSPFQRGPPGLFLLNIRLHPSVYFLLHSAYQHLTLHLFVYLACISIWKMGEA